MRGDLERVLLANGYAFQKVEGLEEQPRMKYYSRDKYTGEIVEHVLPSDAYSMNHYLRKGFKLNPSELTPQVVEAFVCATCGKSFRQRVALAGHSRTHTKIGVR